MGLPRDTGGVTWKDFAIYTPTFKLTPVEKPDMSPFLIHMTGKNAIVSILEGNGAPDHLEEYYGYLKANVPKYAEDGMFNSPVVCFTESPTFAVDFFRYRSFPRWQNDNAYYGIGFDKSQMVIDGARPVIYVDEDTRRTFVQIIRTNKNMVENILPLLFPLLEDTSKQGFMWEREWRHPNPNGFSFHYHSIKVICCPAGEENAIKDILGPFADQVQFVQAWRQYNEVTNFLRQQQEKLSNYPQEPDGKDTREKVVVLKTRINQLLQIKNSLGAYYDLINTLNNERDELEQEMNVLGKEISLLEKDLNKAEEELRPKKIQRRLPPK